MRRREHQEQLYSIGPRRRLFQQRGAAVWWYNSCGMHSIYSSIIPFPEEKKSNRLPLSIPNYRLHAKYREPYNRDEYELMRSTIYSNFVRFRSTFCVILRAPTWAVKLREQCSSFVCWMNKNYDHLMLYSEFLVLRLRQIRKNDRW